MKKAVAKIAIKSLLGVTGPAVILLCWHLYAGDHPNSQIVPSVGSVVDVLLHPTAQVQGFDCEPLAQSTLYSVLRMLTGFALAVVSGIAIGLLMGAFKPVRYLLNPTISAAMTVSPLAWFPLAILSMKMASISSWLNGENLAYQYDTLDRLKFAVIVIIWVGAFFPIALNTLAGVDSVRHRHVEIAKSFGASRWQILTKIVLPSMLPGVFTGLRLAGGIAWRVIVAAEMFPGTTGGLGYMIRFSNSESEPQYAFAAIIVIALVGVVFDGLLRYLQWRSSRWCAASV